MKILSYLLLVLSILAIGAHFLRMGNLPLVLAATALLVLLLVRRRWAAWVVQIGLWIATCEWIRTLVEFSRERAARGEPYTRLVIILGSVALFTALSSLVFFTRHFRDLYSSSPS